MIKYSFLPASIVVLGIFLRVREYLGNRSLWLDEANLALNLINKSFLQLAGPLDREQFAPLGFLWLERLTVVFFGSSEYSLRLAPLIVSCISLPLFYQVSRYFLDKTSTLLALFIFAILNVLIYYSSEVKQYSFDVFMTVLLYYFTLKFFHKTSIKNLIILILIGSLSIWFSYSATFILASIGLVLLIKSFSKKVIIGLSFWLASFLLFYLLNIHIAVDSQSLASFWQWAFAPNPFRSLSHSRWYLDAYLAISSDISVMTHLYLPLAILAVGIILLFKKSKTLTILLTSPLIFAILASMLHKYPLVSRFVLFFAPNFLILLTLGISQLTKTIRKLIPVPVLLSQIVLVGLLFYPSLILDVNYLQRPRVVDDIKPVLEFFSQRRQNDDILYLYYVAEPAFSYYAPKFGLDKAKYIVGISSIDAPDLYKLYIKDLSKLQGQKRVWILFSHAVWTKSGLNEEELFLKVLDTMGKSIDQFFARRASIYLYDLSL